MSINIDYKKRLQFIRKLDIITDIYNNPVDIFQKSGALLTQYLPFRHAILYINRMDGKIEKFFSDSKAKELDNVICALKLNKKKEIIKKDDYEIHIRPLILKNDRINENKKEMFGYFFFFFKRCITFEEKLLLRDYIDFINDSLFLLGKIFKIKNVFSKYIPESIVQKIDKTKKMSSLLEGKKQNICALFVDVRGFTSFSEKNSPENAIELLNNIFSDIVGIIHDNQGMIDKFIGDAALAVFGAPIEYDTPYLNAINAAIEIQKKCYQCVEKYGVGLGIGINYGEAITGNIGTVDRMEYTVIGDTVNTASRLEGLSEKGEILITSSLNEKIKNEFETIEKGIFSLKGKEKKVHIYNVKTVKGVYKQ